MLFGSDCKNNTLRDVTGVKREDTVGLGNGGVSVRIWRACFCLYSTLGPIALLGIPGGLVRFDPTRGIIERAVVSRSGRRRLKRWRMPRRAVMALMAEIDTFREGED